MDPKKMELEAQFLSLLAQPTRLKLLYLLRGGEKCVCEIIPSMREDQSVISRHLIKLRETGILKYRKQGVSVFYSIQEPRVFTLLEIVDDILRQTAQDKAREVVGAL